MGPIGCPETSERNYGSTLRNNPEERRSHLLSGECLKSRIFICLYQDYALQNRHYAETCTLLGHYTTNCGFTTTSRRKPELRHAWWSEHALRVRSAIREIKCERFWTCCKISLLFFFGYYLSFMFKKKFKTLCFVDRTQCFWFYFKHERWAESH